MGILPRFFPVMLFCVAALLPSRAAGQFLGLTTTRDGSDLYFYSTVRQRDTSQTFHSKIFHWDASHGIQVLAEVQSEGQSDGCVTDSFYQLASPRVSADGTVLAYTGSRPGSDARFCPEVETNQAVIGLPDRQIKVSGTVTLSPNGRYAITTPVAAADSSFHVVTDLASGVSTAVAGIFSGSAQAVTNEATIATASGMAIVLTGRNGGTQLVQTRYPVNDVIVDQSGSTLVYLTRLFPTAGGGASPGHISTVDITTGSESQLTTNFAPMNPVITADARTVFFVDSNVSGFGGTTLSSTTQGPQLYAVGIDGTGLRQISNEADGISSMIVSGDGLVAYAVTGKSRLVRIEVVSGRSTELAPETPLVSSAYVGFARTTVVPVGSWVTLLGSGLDRISQLKLCGHALPVPPTTLVQFSSGISSAFQVPLDFQEGLCELIVDTASPLEHGIVLDVRTIAPQFLPSLIHQDFKGVVIETAPAEPGELIIAYMTGLGPLDHGGQVMPGFSCSLDGVPVSVPYAGVAPGYSGYYQVNLAIPKVSPGPANLRCGWDASMQVATIAVWIG